MLIAKTGAAMAITGTVLCAKGNQDAGVPLIVAGVTLNPLGMYMRLDALKDAGEYHRKEQQFTAEQTALDT